MQEVNSCFASDTGIYHGQERGRDIDEFDASFIAACSKAGGGRVLVPAGDWLVVGPIHLKSNVNLHVEKGATIVPDRAAVFATADIVVQVLCYGSNDITGKADLPLMRRGQTLIGFLRPLGSAEVVQQIAQAGVTSFSVELMPRTTRAQSMDALSSMATCCGYKAVLLAAETSPRIFPVS